MSLMHIIAGPLIGAAIGYCTNWLAVKMMFKPLEPVKLFNRTMPFTPGVIPKNRDRIARACGRAVGESLLTEEDLKKAFFDEDMKEVAVSKICQQILSDDMLHMTVAGAGREFFGEEKSNEVKVGTAEFLTERITGALSQFDFGEIITRIGSSFIREKLNNPMISMFINDSLIASLAEPLAENMREYVAADGRARIEEISQKEVENISDLKLNEVVNVSENRESIEKIVASVYDKSVAMLVPEILGHIDVSEIVEKKIAQMDIKFLEDLILSVMKTELDYIVRLGALIGMIIGAINILI